ncbi:MAG: MFS transporter [Frankia sp.]
MARHSSSIRSALRRSPRFRRLLAALAVSQAGDWLYNLALLAFVYDRTHSPGWLAATTAVRVLPMVVLGPVAGVLATRWPHRTAMIVSDVVRAMLMVLLALAAAGGWPVVFAPLLAGLATTASSIYPPCVAASTTHLLREPDLPAANAARSVTTQVCIVAGPAAGGLLLLLGPPAVVFVLNAATFVVSALLVASIPAGPDRRPGAAPAERETAERETVGSGIRAGAAALRAHPIALRVVGADIICSGVYGVLSVVLILIAHRLGGTAGDYGYLLTGFGFGGVMVTPLASRAAAAAAPPTQAAARLTVGGPVPARLLAPDLPVAVLLCVAIGGGSVLVEVLAETTLQRSLADTVFTQAYGLAFPASIGGILIGAIVTPALLATLGLNGLLLALATAVAAYAGILLRPARTRHPALARTPQQLFADQ